MSSLDKHTSSSLLVGVGYFATVYALKFYASLTRLGFTTFAYLFVCIFFLSVNGAYGIYYFGKKLKINNQYKFANDFLIDRDIFWRVSPAGNSEEDQ